MKKFSFLLLLIFVSYFAWAVKPVEKSNATVATQHQIASDVQSVDVKKNLPDWREKILSIIADPVLAYILFFIGIYGLFFEFANPGMVLPGLIGVVALLFSLYAFAFLPVSYIGLSLILIGVACLVGEIVIASFGILGVIGIAVFVAGSILLFDFKKTGMRIPWEIITTMCVVSAAFFFLVIQLAVRSYRKKIVSGREELIGMEGEIIKQHNDMYLVRVHGEIWQAKAQEMLQPGQKICVTKIKNLTLTVESKKISGE